MTTKIEQPKFKFNLGEELSDKITGYQGLEAARTEWLYGCRRYMLQSKEMKDGKPVESLHCDEMALQRVKAAPKGKRIQETGGPHDDPVRGQTVTRR